MTERGFCWSNGDSDPIADLERTQTTVHNIPMGPPPIWMSAKGLRTLQDATAKALADAEVAVRRSEDRIRRARRRLNNATRRNRGECRRKLAQAFEQREEVARRWEKAKVYAEKLKNTKALANVGVTDIADGAWLKWLTAGTSQWEVNAASKSVLETLLDALAGKDVRRVDALLRMAPVEQLAPQVALAFLAGTLTAKGALAERAAFYQRVEEKLLRDEPQRVSALLKGLR